MIKNLVGRIRGRKARQLVIAGNEHFERGEMDQAFACAKEAISSYDRESGAYALMSRILMPGDDYLTLLKRVHEVLKPESYVEVGVDKGRSMKLIQPGTKAVGIDPAPQVESGNETSAKIFSMFSDDFFKSHNLLDELDSSRVAMAFVDGSHIFEQTLRDIMHIEKYSDKETVMVLHDCIPMGRVTAERKRITDFWCGDVWKLVDCLKKYRPDLDINVISASPSGLVLITGLDSSSTVLHDQYDEIEAEYVNMDLGYDCISKDMMSQFLPSEWKRVEACLPL